MQFIKLKKSCLSKNPVMPGTLDLLASGVLPVALRRNNKNYTLCYENTKSYLFIIKWGEQRDTDDASGKIIKQSNIKTSNEEIKKALPKFIGTVEQTPPNFSAINIVERVHIN